MERAPAVEMQLLGRSIAENESREYEDGKVCWSAIEMQRIMIYIQETKHGNNLNFQLGNTNTRSNLEGTNLPIIEPDIDRKNIFTPT